MYHPLVVIYLDGVVIPKMRCLQVHFLDSWIGMNPYTYQANSIEGVKVERIGQGASADGILEEVISL